MIFKKEENMKWVKNTFYISYVFIIIFLVSLFLFYRSVFNGELSKNVSDWEAFVSIFNGVGILLLTGLDVWIVYRLTITIAEKEEEHRLYTLKKDMLNRFINLIYSAFTPDAYNPICTIKEENLKRVFINLELMSKLYGANCNIFMEKKYADFVEEFRGFCLDYQQENSANPQGKNMEEEAYKLFIKAIEIENDICKEINGI